MIPAEYDNLAEQEELDDLLFWAFMRWEDAKAWLCAEIAPFGASPQRMIDGGAGWVVIEWLRRNKHR